VCVCTVKTVTLHAVDLMLSSLNAWPSARHVTLCLGGRSALLYDALSLPRYVTMMSRFRLESRLGLWLGLELDSS
jgi:hypothetical protein